MRQIKRTIFHKILGRLATLWGALSFRVRRLLFGRWYVRGFHELLYGFLSQGFGSSGAHLHWLGAPVLKSPLDAWIYQEIIWETKPDILLETGTYRGGSSLFFATVMDAVGKGVIVTTDIEALSDGVSHPRIRKIIGDSTSTETFKRVCEKIDRGAKVMVVLDSAHRYEHVLRELEMYAPLVSSGCYLVVEDTNVNGHPVLPGWGLGPQEALFDFIGTHPEFAIDRSREKLMVTFHPSGFLRRR